MGSLVGIIPQRCRFQMFTFFLALDSEEAQGLRSRPKRAMCGGGTPAESRNYHTSHEHIQQYKHTVHKRRVA